MNKLETVTNLIQNWNSTGTNSKKDPAFVSFSNLFKKAIKEELAKIGVHKVIFNVGHYTISGFFTFDSGKTYYFSLSDVRNFNEKRILVRTAKNEKDYTGGCNNWVDLQEDMFINYRF